MATRERVLVGVGVCSRTWSRRILIPVPITGLLIDFWWCHLELRFGPEFRHRRAWHLPVKL